jgi:hypothetical protein
MAGSRTLRLLLPVALVLSFVRVSQAEAPEPAPGVAHQQAPAEWWDRYGQGRALLLREDYAGAAEIFESLQGTATSVDQKRLASELAMIARALEGEHEALRPDARRTADELSLLYSTAFFYGFGTSAWVALQTQPNHFAGAVLPFAVLTSASVGGVAVADGYSPLQRGVPHSISAGLYLGFVEGVWTVGLQHSASTRVGGGHWNSARVSTILWTGATAGAITGGLVGDAFHPEPGNVSFVSSSAMWGGIVSGMFGAASQADVDYRAETAFIVAGVGYNLGLATGLFVVPSEPLSVARVRLTDVSGLAGGLLTSAAYLAIAADQADPRLAFGAAGLGAGAGLGLGWWLTDGMKPKKQDPIGNVSFAPVLMPTPAGISIGVVGAM